MIPRVLRDALSLSRFLLEGSRIVSHPSARRFPIASLARARRSTHHARRDADDARACDADDVPPRVHDGFDDVRVRARDDDATRDGDRALIRDEPSSTSWARAREDDAEIERARDGGAIDPMGLHPDRAAVVDADPAAYSWTKQWYPVAVADVIDETKPHARRCSVWTWWCGNLETGSGMCLRISARIDWRR